MISKEVAQEFDRLHINPREQDLSVGMRRHIRDFKATHPDTPFSRLLEIQEKERAEEKIRAETIERVKRENARKDESERWQKGFDLAWRRLNQLEAGIRHFKDGRFIEDGPTNDVECAEWTVEEAFLRFKVGWYDKRGVVDHLSGNIRVGDEKIDVLGIRDRVLTLEEISRYEDEPLRF